MAYQDRDERMARIARKVEGARARLEQQIEEERGVITSQDALLLDAYCDIHRIRLEAVEAVQEQGLRETYSNGRQRCERENKAVGQVMKATVTEARVLAALKLNKGQAVDLNDDGADLDDY